MRAAVSLQRDVDARIQGTGQSAGIVHRCTTAIAGANHTITGTVRARRGLTEAHNGRDEVVILPGHMFENTVDF